jgi:hypothetical protein
VNTNANTTANTNGNGNASGGPTPTATPAPSSKVSPVPRRATVDGSLSGPGSAAGVANSESQPPSPPRENEGVAVGAGRE